MLAVVAGDSMSLFSACQADGRETEQVWRSERKRQMQDKRQIKDL